VRKSFLFLTLLSAVLDIPLAHRFCEWMVPKDGQLVVESLEYFPLPAEKRQEAMRRTHHHYQSGTVTIPVLCYGEIRL